MGAEGETGRMLRDKEKGRDMGMGAGREMGRGGVRGVKN